MKFGPVAASGAEGDILAHATVAGDLRLHKGRRLSAADIAVLVAAGVGEIIVARLDPGDLSEDEAAFTLASALSARNVETKKPATGRVNIHAIADGVFTVDRALIDAINAIDPAVTVATLAEHAPVTRGRMVATVKIIPFAVPGSVVHKAVALAKGLEAFAVHPYSARRVAVIQTTLPGLKPSVLDKTLRITADRLARSASSVVSEARVPHDAALLAKAIGAAIAQSDMVVTFGASAMSDEDDVIPAAIRLAGGEVIRAGMPVDPGNLIVLGRLAGKPVLGAPGCARSPKENGFDWVLDRLTAGLDVTAGDIAGMGVGGLLMEIPTRPQPREASPQPRFPTVHVIVLAAGRSTRMGGPNKLLASFGGAPLVRRTVEAAVGSAAASTVIVTGHQADRVRVALDGLDVAFVANADFASGLASSLKAGIAALPSSAEGALIVLGDMPGVSAPNLDVLIAAFRRAGGMAIVRATHAGRRGNPVILPRSVFAEVAALEGDVGARHIVEQGSARIVDVEIGEAASLDVDTPQAMSDAGGVLQD